MVFLVVLVGGKLFSAFGKTVSATTLKFIFVLLFSIMSPSRQNKLKLHLSNPLVMIFDLINAFVGQIFTSVNCWL